MMKKLVTFLSSDHQDCVVAKPANDWVCEDLPFAEPVRLVRLNLFESHVVWVELTSNYQRPHDYRSFDKS